MREIQKQTDTHNSDSKNRKTLNNSTSSNIFPDHIIHDNKTITDSQDITNTFNNYFTNLGNRLANDIPAPNNRLTDPSLITSPIVHQTLFFSPITPEEMKDLFHLLKSGKSAGTDNIDPGIANRSYAHITSPLMHIFNHSLYHTN